MSKAVAVQYPLKIKLSEHQLATSRNELQASWTVPGTQTLGGSLVIIPRGWYPIVKKKVEMVYGIGFTSFPTSISFVCCVRNPINTIVVSYINQKFHYGCHHFLCPLRSSLHSLEFTQFSLSVISTNSWWTKMSVCDPRSMDLQKHGSHNLADTW